MNTLATTLTSLALLASPPAPPAQPGPDASATAPIQESQAVRVTRGGSQPSRRGPAESFTGQVRVDPLFQATEPSRTSGAYVTFEPGARTAWHTHPLGQTLVVTAGLGRVQRWGGPIEEIRPGDVVWIPPGQKHWHGASPSTAMTHIAIQEQLDGKAVEWREKVTDEQFGSAPSPRSSRTRAAAGRHDRPLRVHRSPSQAVRRARAMKSDDLARLPAAPH